MKRFFCDCGQQVFFDSTECVNCGLRLGYDQETRNMLTLTAREGTPGSWKNVSGDDNTIYRLCANAEEYGVCNWLVGDPDRQYCTGCHCNRTIPNLGKPQNLWRWNALENAKRRLVYSLQMLGLPIISRWDDRENGLWFDFLEDQRSDNEIYEGFVSTGHIGGVITINVLEADDVQRESMRTAMNEQYRTLLGHFRHESGHFYWQYFFHADSKAVESFREMFGDERNDYNAAVAEYYSLTPDSDQWQGEYISAYASSHPMEDWAESWAHFLHMYDTIDSAMAYGFIDQWPEGRRDFDFMTRNWMSLSLGMNELNRSMGLSDAYPFVLADGVIRKLRFIHDLLEQH